MGRRKNNPSFRTESLAWELYRQTPVQWGLSSGSSIIREPWAPRAILLVILSVCSTTALGIYEYALCIDEYALCALTFLGKTLSINTGVRLTGLDGRQSVHASKG